MNVKKTFHPSTLCAYLGRSKQIKSGFVNPPSTRGSTYLYSNVADFHAYNSSAMQLNGIGYGRYGSETTRELEQALAALDGAYGAMVLPSGFSAISTAIFACVSQGDHLLMADTVYDPTRRFAAQTLARLGIETTFYPVDSSIAELAELVQANTRLIYLESPGSLTMEVQDIDAIIQLAKQHKLLTLLDNTWASSVIYPAIKKGINISIQAATKYIGGHSDLMMGVICADDENWENVRKAYVEFGHSPGTEETMLALRGLRTLPCRLKQHGESALIIATWLETQTEVMKMYFPALPSSPDYALFQRQYSAPTGLFSFTLACENPKAIAAMIDGLDLFAIGESWGGYESLILPIDPSAFRTAKPWINKDPIIRIYIGLEHPDDLIADLQQGFRRLRTEIH